MFNKTFNEWTVYVLNHGYQTKKIGVQILSATIHHRDKVSTVGYYIAGKRIADTTARKMYDSCQ